MFMLVVLTGIASSCKYDDEELWDYVTDLADRISTLETLTKQMNGDIAAMQSIISALENKVYISEVEKLTDGYILHFTDGTTATIKNGIDGLNGKDAPIVGVKQEKGVYYWTITVDGETSWLTDEKGNKLPVSGTSGTNGEDGKNGVTPLLKVDGDGYWMVSYDNGSSYTHVLDVNGHKVYAVGPEGPAGSDGVNGRPGADGKPGADGNDGDSKFQNIEVQEDKVIITLADGTKFEIPISKSGVVYTVEGKVVDEKEIEITQKGSVTLKYEISKMDDVTVEILSKSGVTVNLDENKQEITITHEAGELISEAKVVLLFYNDEQTLTSVLKFKEAWSESTKKVRANSKYYDTIKDALKDNSSASSLTIELAEGEYAEVVDVTGGKNITIQPKTTGEEVTIAGLGHQSNGTPSTVTVKGITFDNSITPEGWFTGTAQNIAPCVGAWGGNFTFEGCKFIVAGASGKETGVMTWWTTSPALSFVFNDCEFEGKEDHANARAMQIYGNVNMEVNNCTFNTKKDYTLKYVAEEGNVAIFNNNRVNNSVNFVELGSSTYPGSKYTVKINDTTLGEGVSPYIIANDEDQLVYIDGVCSVSTNKQLAYAVSQGITNIMLVAGSYTVPDAAKGKTLTISGSTGNPEDVKVAVIGIGGENCDYGLDGSTVTFEGITITTNSSTYIGYARCDGTYKNCIINGTYTLYGNSTFENCTFNVSGDVYNIWTWGAPTATFTGCTFNSDGKAMLLYGRANTKLAINSCIFNDKGGLTDKKAAIEIGNDYDKSYELIVNNTTVNGYEINDNGINTNTTLWANKNSMPKDKLNVVVDGVDVY